MIRKHETEHGQFIQCFKGRYILKDDDLLSLLVSFLKEFKKSSALALLAAFPT